MHLDGAVVILAAGLGTRMGRPKADLPFGNSTFLQCCLDKLSGLEFAFSAVVTNSAIAQTTKQSLPSGFKLVLNPEPKTGQLESLRLALPKGALECPWTLVMLVDLPAVEKGTVEQLVAKAQEEPQYFWVPSFQGRRGHPVIYTKAMYPDLLDGPTQEGARWAVQRHKGKRRELEVDDQFILRDVDTPSDYQEILEKAHREI